MNSDMSEIPGPEVLVKARAPFQPAPVTMPIEASSSSAWMMANLFLPVSLSTRSFEQYFWNASASEEDGVIGYQAQTVAPPYTQPRAAAALPSMKIWSPTLYERFTLSPSSFFCLRPQSRPIWNALRFGLRSFSFPLYCS